MRKLLMALITLVTAGLFTAPAANAARWTCDGPAYVCGSGHQASAASSDASERRSARPSRAARTEPRLDREQRATRSRRQDVASGETYSERPARRSRVNPSYDSRDSGGGSTSSGKASYYSEPQAVASGGRFNPNALTAAHKTLPFGTRVRVTNQSNGRSVDVVINDRGPYVGGRIIDLSRAAAGAINMQGAGVAPVTMRMLGRS